MAIGAQRPQFQQLPHHAGVAHDPLFGEALAGGGCVDFHPSLGGGVLCGKWQARRHDDGGAVGTACRLAPLRRLGSIAICAVQLFLSLWLRSFAVPVALALVGGIIGLLFTSQGWGIDFPYALLSLGMRANNPNLVLELPQFILSAVLYTLLFAALTIRLLKKRDVSGE